VGIRHEEMNRRRRKIGRGQLDEVGEMDGELERKGIAG
jgi:hypothetical protein